MAVRGKALTLNIFLLISLVACFLIASISASCLVPYGSPNIAIVGRHQPLSGATPGTQWDWSSIQVSVVVSKTTAVSIQLTDAENMYNIIIDGTLTQVLTANNSNTPYPIATGLNPSLSHTITLFKRTEASFGVVTFYGFVLEGPSDDGSGNCNITRASPPSTTRGKIEFLGDSLTCGYGNLGIFPCSFSAATEDGALAYGNLVAQALNAELHQESWSGLGVVRNAGDTNPTSPNPFPPRFAYSLGTQSNTVWNYTLWVPDAVVINLGTNDYSTPPRPPQDTFENGLKALVSTIRTGYSSNPNLQIFLACGPFIDDPCCSYIRNVVNASGANIHYINLMGLIYNLSGQIGCDFHPNVPTHQLMADWTFAAIRQYWPYPVSTPTTGGGNNQASAASSIRPAAMASWVAESFKILRESVFLYTHNTAPPPIHVYDT